MNNKNKIPSEQDRHDILNYFDHELKLITPLKEEIKKLSQYACQVLNTYNDYIFPDLLKSIIREANKKSKIEYLYLFLDIILFILCNDEYKLIRNNSIKKIFPYLKDVIRSFHYSLNDNDIKEVKKVLNQLKINKIYDDKLIDELMMELTLATEPDITGDNEEIKNICNLINKNIFEVPSDIINYNEKLEIIKKNKDNAHKLELIKLQNNIIKKQIDKYNKNLQQIKDLNSLIEKCEIYE